MPDALLCAASRAVNASEAPGPQIVSGTHRLQFARTGHEVGVDVRFFGGDDLQAGVCGGGEVEVDIASRIDDHCFAAAIAGDQIRRLSEAGFKMTVETSGRIQPAGVR